MLDQHSRIKPSPKHDPRWVTPTLYTNADASVLVPLFEERSGWTISIIEQHDGETGMYQSHDRKGCGNPDKTLWLHAWVNEHERAVFDYISEERGRTVFDQALGEWTVVAEHRSPWDDKIEKALAQVHPHGRGPSNKKRPSLLTLWRHYLFLSEWDATEFDAKPDDWRFGRVLRQIEQLGEAIAIAEVSTFAEVKIKLEFLQLRASAIAPNAEVNATVRTVARALNRLVTATKPVIRQEMRHAA